jgi:uncharacterized protein (DUF2147 family)
VKILAAIVTGLLLAATTIAPAFAANPSGQFDPYGTWMRPSTGTQVSFYDCGGRLCAKIVAVTDERRKSKIGTVI